jgi:hypothetical protein
MSEAELTARSAPGVWSIKDNLAHLVYWEQYMLERIRRAVEHGEAPQWVNNEEETRINAQILEENKERALPQVLEDLWRSYQQVAAQVEALNEPDLTDPQRFPWLKGDPLAKYIEDEAFGEHFHEHLKLY